MKKECVGFAMCGSFCTFQKAVEQLEKLVEAGYTVLPIMSGNAYRLDTRFGNAADWIQKVEKLCERPIIHTITEAEPIGPKKLVDIMVVCPCTGNTAAKLAGGITDTSVTMAVKSSLRNQIPVLLTMATNDALSGSAMNLGKLLNTKNIYFTPMGQDDSEKKPTSIIADFNRVMMAIDAAKQGKQLQPLLL